MMKKIFLILFSVTFLASAAYTQETISRIDIEGNEIVSDATIVSKIKIRASQPYNENVINEDIKNLYATGFFEIVDAQRKDTQEGIVIIFKVEEKPILKKIIIEGAKVIRKKKILQLIDIKEGSFADEYKLKEIAKKIKDFYFKKGFSQAEVAYEQNFLETRKEVEVKFIISEKEVLKVREVTVKGNKSFSAGKIIKLMKTRPAWFLNKGIFKEDVLRDDEKRLTDFYRLKGFSNVEVSLIPEYKPKGVCLIVNIDEGRRYYVGKVNIEGNKEVSLEELSEAVDLKQGSIFSEQAVYIDSSRIREVYVDKGYIFSQVEPFSLFNPQAEKVDITYKISENKVAYIEDIEIKGNVKTKDKVIRRELKVYPGNRFDGKKVKRSKEKLENLGFFEEIRFGTEPGSKPDNIDLVVDVKEAKTGYFSFGGGYSSIDEFIGFIELRQRNFDYRNFSTFTGGGQDLSLTFSIGTLTDRYQLSFTNPWIFDEPVSFGFDGYKKGHKQDENVGYGYAEEVKGGALRLGREFNDYWDGTAAYRLERVEITDIADDATNDLLKEAGANDLSSMEFSLGFDNRDSVFSPSKGIIFQNSFQFTGGPFGGDKDFAKYFSRLSFYFPVVHKSVVELKLRGGFAEPFSDSKEIPIYERFFAGGASTIRGYRERKVGPIDTVADDPLGGDAMFIGNIEYTYPLVNFLKVAGFFDSGNVWKKNNDEDSNFEKSGIKSSVGMGLRVKTPIGPVSIDYGWPLNLEPGEEQKEGRFHFNVSRAF
ncbi:MAG: outer membrane protein assembly factor BamA [Candidatus Omnitrophota bacterium]